MTANKILDTKEIDDVVVTHAENSNARKKVRYFTPQDLQINRVNYLSLPVSNGKVRQNVSEDAVIPEIENSFLIQT